MPPPAWGGTQLPPSTVGLRWAFSEFLCQNPNGAPCLLWDWPVSSSQLPWGPGRACGPYSSAACKGFILGYSFPSSVISRVLLNAFSFPEVCLHTLSIGDLASFLKISGEIFPFHTSTLISEGSQEGLWVEPCTEGPKWTWGAAAKRESV